MRIIFFISLFAMIKALSYLDEVPKDINELFPKANNSNNDTINNIAAFDIQKIDIDKFIEKIGSINNSFINEETSARKRGIPLNMTKVGSEAYRTAYTNAADIIAKQKLCDLMLQIIYMARHGMRRLEANPLFNRNDIGYRIGILFSKMKRMYKKMKDIFQTMINSDKEEYFAAEKMSKDLWFTPREDRYLILHHRMVKLHTDYIYLFWVIVKIDAVFTKMNDVGIRPPLNNETAGISIENSEIG